MMKEQPSATVAARQPKKNILKRYFTDMPVFFPLIGLFLIAMAGYELQNYWGDNSVSAWYLWRPAILLLYAVFWAGICFRQKWAAIAFVVLTIANVSYYFWGPDSYLHRAIGDLLFIPIPVNLLFAFVLLFFFRKLK
ncbi:MAG: hypothetical protein QM642_03555 [Edaphocola sp.]